MTIKIRHLINTKKPILTYGIYVKYPTLCGIMTFWTSSQTPSITCKRCLKEKGGGARVV